MLLSSQYDLPVSMVKEIRVKFQEADSDGSGSISRTELEQMMNKLGYSEYLPMLWTTFDLVIPHYVCVDLVCI